MWQAAGTNLLAAPPLDHAGRSSRMPFVPGSEALGRHVHFDRPGAPDGSGRAAGDAAADFDLRQQLRIRDRAKPEDVYLLPLPS